MERIVHVSRSFDEVAEWDVRQHLAMSPQGRQRVARALKGRAFPADSKDVRACVREAQGK
jgi:hypothetical protein